MTLHVALNGYFWDKATVGVGQYLHGLVNAIQRIDAIQLTIIIPAYTSPPAVPQGVRLYRVTTPFDGRSRNLGKLWFEQIAVPHAAALIGADLLHIPYFAPPYYSKVPVITTIPDLIPITRLAYRGSPFVRLYTALVTTAARRSSGIIAISQHVADQASQILPYPSARMSVTHLAADPIYSPQADAIAVVAQHGIVGPYIYYVGGYDERKNVIMLLHAFAALPAPIRAHTWLVLAGQAAGNNPTLFPDIDNEIAHLGIGARVKRVTVSRFDGPAYYSAATIFVYPSLAEGFGLPPLEAMACGTPVIVSNSTSLPEVVGDAAISIDPTNQAAWRDAIAQLLNDPNQRHQLRAAGMHRAHRFSYDITAMQTAAFYTQIATRG